MFQKIKEFLEVCWNYRYSLIKDIKLNKLINEREVLRVRITKIEKEIFSLKKENLSYVSEDLGINKIYENKKEMMKLAGLAKEK